MQTLRAGLAGLFTVFALWSFSTDAFADQTVKDANDTRLPCKYDPGDTSACAPYACVPDVPTGTDENLITAGTPGFCGKCQSDRGCGGAACKSTGLCAGFDPSPRPEPVWPHFHLLVTDAAVNLFDGAPSRPIVSAGYMFQGAFGETHPESFDGHGYLTSDLPRFYWNAGATVALAGPAQNIFVDGGLTRYAPGAPFSITTFTVGAEYQRQGSAIWRPSGTLNEDRLGPSVSLGFLQNAFVRLSYVFPLHGPNDHGALFVGVSYMKDLLGDLLPDRLKKFLPAKIQ
ncbi:MAG TPA: hypothetical protein VGL59_04580 [Polyangia bacterium]